MPAKVPTKTRKPISKKEKAQKEKTLITSQNHFERMEQISRTGSFTWDLSEDHLSCSKNFFQITGIKPNRDLILDKEIFFDLINKEKQNFVLDVMHECIITNDDFIVTFDLSKNSEKKLRLHGYPQGDINSKVFIGLIEDITEKVESTHAIITGQDLERKRISLEIHDSVGQKLIAAKYRLALIKMTNDVAQLPELDDSLNEIISEIRAITHNLSSQVVIEVGLKNAIGQILNETIEGLGATKEYIYDLRDNRGKEIILEEETGKMIYRIIQETLTNALKHSEATHISVNISTINSQIIINIADNGKGMDNQEVLKKGIGLQNIKERATCLNGFVRINTEKNRGFNTVIKIPLNNG